MLIAQVTDLHVGPGRSAARARKRLKAVLKALRGASPQPDLIVVTGDLVEDGEPGEYAALKPLLADLPWPLHLTIGNHDHRENFHAAFPATPMVEGFVHYAIDAGPVRVIVIDTHEPGQQDGGFCEVRAKLLDDELARAPDRPTIIAGHHPPIPTGVTWMAESPDTPWIERLGAVIEKHPQVERVICGHMHRPINRLWRGALVTCSPASTVQLALDLTPMPRSAPDGRAIVMDEPPGFMLFHHEHGGVTAHTVTVGDHKVVARFPVATSA